MRDYLAWHDAYADPGSGLSWRLAKVRGYLRDEFDGRAGELRVVSVCAGDGRDVLGVLGNLTDADARRTLDAVPQLCGPGALVVWSRGLFDDVVEHRDNHGLRAQLASLGCVEIDFAEHRSDDGKTSVGAVRFAGTPRELPAGERLFTFVR